MKKVKFGILVPVIASVIRHGKVSEIRILKVVPAKNV